MKKKRLSENSRNFVYMGIKDNSEKTRIYLYGISKEGKNQWYQSKCIFTRLTASKYLSAGRYSVVFAGGIEKSGETDWI